MKIIKHGQPKEISFKCAFCACEWIATPGETKHYICSMNGKKFDIYSMECPECGRDVSETIEKETPE